MRALICLKINFRAHNGILVENLSHVLALGQNKTCELALGQEKLQEENSFFIHVLFILCIFHYFVLYYVLYFVGSKF